MNELAKIQLFRPAASLPWAELETTQHNIRITHYESSEEGSSRTTIVLTPKRAKELAKALNVLIENYSYDPSNKEDEL